MSLGADKQPSSRTSRDVRMLPNAVGIVYKTDREVRRTETHNTSIIPMYTT